MNDITQAEFDLVDDTSTFFAPAATDMIDGLLGQYRAMRHKIREIADFIVPRLDGGAIDYFLEGNRTDERGRLAMSLSAKQLFDEPGAVASLNAAYWSKALQLTDVLDLMPQKRREEWNAQILNPAGIKKPRASWDKGPVEWEQPPIPEFEETTVRDTLMGLLNMRSQFLAERVDGIFRALSKTHVTNAPEGFSKRMILSHVTNEWGHASSGQTGVINDLRCVIAKFMGREEPKWDATGSVVRFARTNRCGQWVTIDGGALRLRCYMVGTAHLEVHPDMAWRLNAILAQLHPLAIPSQFRERPKKKLKAFTLMGRPLPFAVVARLSTLDHARDSNPNRGWRENTWIRVDGCYDLKFGSQLNKVVEEEVTRVLEALGGAPVEGKPNRWAFDYSPLEVIKEIEASGCIPDQKAHQFYPTPATLARVLVDMADIGPEHSVLEPSAGHGGLADLLPKERTLCVEVAALNCKVLEAKGHRVAQADFIKFAESTGSRFDRVVMNPPFSEGRAEAHTLAAASLLRPGGRLVAILPSGMRGKDLPGLACTWSQPMSNQFPGVSIDVVLLAADRPA